LGVGEGMTGFSLSLTLRVCSLSAMRPSPPCYGWRSPVALGYDAADRVIVVHHQNGADPALGQDVHGFGDRSIGSDGYDVGSLALMTAATCMQTARLCGRSPARRPFEGA
jgi:hypothetical protein